MTIQAASPSGPKHTPSHTGEKFWVLYFVCDDVYNCNTSSNYEKHGIASVSTVDFYKWCFSCKLLEHKSGHSCKVTDWD